MKILNRLGRLVAALILFTCTTTSLLAKESGFYLGVDIGQSKYHAEESDFAYFPIRSGVELDKTGMAYSLSFGYQFTPYVGAELSLRDLGKFHYKETGFITTTPSLGGFTDLEVGVRGEALQLVGTLPINKLELFGKLGAMYSTMKGNSRVTSTFGTLPANTTGVAIGSSTSTDVVYGLGVGYLFADEFFLKGEWSRVDSAGDGAEINVDTIFLGFQFRF